MSRLSTRNRDLMTFHKRSDQLNTEFFKKKKLSQRPLTERDSNRYLSKILTQSTIKPCYNIKEGVFETSFIGRIPIPRNTFQLTSNQEIALLESSSIPALKKPKDIHLHLLEDMKKMIPSTVRSRRDLKLCLQASIKQLKLLKIKPDELYLLDHFIPKAPFGRPNAKEFFKRCKAGDAFNVEIMLRKDKYLAYDFDNMKMTALHWAVLRGNYEIVNLLLEFNAFIDATDYSHRTALHIAARSGNTEILKLLLKFNPDLNIITTGKKSVLQFACNEVCQDIIKRYSKEKFIGFLSK